jgi:integrase
MAERYKLKASQLGKAKKPGMLNDGGGLYLSTSKSLTQSWIYRYRKRGRLRDIGLGSTNDVSLADARDFADMARKAVKAGRDPRVAIKGESGPVTFKKAAEAYIATHSPGWRNAKHKSQWENTLETYAFPEVGDMSVAAIDVDHVLSVLTPIWYTKNETANRVRARIESVLAWSTVKGHREGFNPAVWRGNLDAVLPARGKVQKVKHLAALPYEELPDLFPKLDKIDAVGGFAVCFTILTACRSGEVRGATWDEIQGDIWVIPGERMKAGKEHRVPLSPAALAILDKLEQSTGYIFPGNRIDSAISDMTMTKLLKSRRTGITVHGMRSTFRDWVAEETEYPNHVAEMALAHKVSSAVERAYRRGDLLAKRRDLMNEWADFVTGGAK